MTIDDVRRSHLLAALSIDTVNSYTHTHLSISYPTIHTAIPLTCSSTVLHQQQCRCHKDQSQDMPIPAHPWTQPSPPHPYTDTASNPVQPSTSAFSASVHLVGSYDRMVSGCSKEEVAGGRQRMVRFICEIPLNARFVELTRPAILARLSISEYRFLSLSEGESSPGSRSRPS